MSRGVILTAICLAAGLSATGCQDEWDLKWPELEMGNKKPAPLATDSAGPTEPLLTPEEQVAKLRRQIETLRRRLETVENKNAELRKSDQGVEELRKKLQQQTFTAKMQAEDLKVLKMAAIERDTYRARLRHLERENKRLNARIAELLKGLTTAPAGGTSGGVIPTTKPAKQ